eukprot:scaffold2088_cov119-Cylindrotheca_fusiformis.AAC.3
MSKYEKLTNEQEALVIHYLSSPDKDTISFRFLCDSSPEVAGTQGSRERRKIQKRADYLRRRPSSLVAAQRKLFGTSRCSSHPSLLQEETFSPPLSTRSPRSEEESIYRCISPPSPPQIMSSNNNNETPLEDLDVIRVKPDQAMM